MSETAALIAESAEQLLAEQLSPEVAEAAEAGCWPEALWQALEASGFLDALRPGSEVTPSEALLIVRVAARRAAPVPLAETMQARRALAAAGLAVPPGPLGLAASGETVTLDAAPAGEDWRLSGTLGRVPFARDAGRVVALARTTDGPVVVVVPSESAVLVLGRSLAGEPRDEVRFDDTPLAREALAPAPAGLTDPLAWLYDGALMRSAQIVGALEAALEASVAYANERVQFGRPIGRFQAIQHQLAQFGGEVAASSAALDRAVQALERQEPSAQLAIAAAKARASEAAGVGAAIAHQVHGAIGFSRAFALQRLTRRLWSWREEYGSEGFWHQRLAARLLAAPDGPWLALAAV